jgi:hypothetical protein
LAAVIGVLRLATNAGGVVGRSRIWQIDLRGADAMTEAELQNLSDLLRVGALLVGAVVVIMGLAALSRRPRARQDNKAATWIAAAWGIVVAAPVEFFFGGIAGMDVGYRPEHYLQALPLAIVAGGVAALMSLAGLGIVGATRRFSALALGGAIIGPLVLGTAVGAVETGVIDPFGAEIGRLQIVEAANQEAGVIRENAAIEERSRAITPLVRVVDVTYGRPSGAGMGVDRVAIELVLTADTEMHLGEGAKLFALKLDEGSVPPKSQGAEPWDQAGFGSCTLEGELPGPIMLQPRVPTTIRVELVSNDFMCRDAGFLPSPGSWYLRTFMLQSVDGDKLYLTADFAVPQPGT